MVLSKLPTFQSQVSQTAGSGEVVSAVIIELQTWANDTGNGAQGEDSDRVNL